MSESRKEELCFIGEAMGCTINGHLALILGTSLPYAIVRRMDGKGDPVEVSWSDVERIVSEDGQFRA